MFTKKKKKNAYSSTALTVCQRVLNPRLLSFCFSSNPICTLSLLPFPSPPIPSLPPSQSKRRARQGKRSPGSGRERVERFEYSDRYIPCRDGVGGSPSQARFSGGGGPAVPPSLLNGGNNAVNIDGGSSAGASGGGGDGGNGGAGGGGGGGGGGGARLSEPIKSTYDMLLKNELLGGSSARTSSGRSSSGKSYRDGFRSASTSPGGDKIFRFREAAGVVYVILLPLAPASFSLSFSQNLSLQRGCWHRARHFPACLLFFSGLALDITWTRAYVCCSLHWYMRI